MLAGEAPSEPGPPDGRQGLLADGKSRMVVRIAVARMLLVRLNAKARDARARLKPA